MFTMEVEDRHLNVIVDLINAMLVSNCEPLSYLSEQFSPSDMVWRLSQLIIIYENHISSDSQLLGTLQYDIRENSLSACSAIRVWLLEYYKSDFVTLNECKLEDGVEEEIVLTALMVLRVLFRMRQMLGFRLNQVLTNGWKDLHEFDEPLDEKFETRCLKLMDLLVKLYKQKHMEIEALVKQINSLTEDKTVLEDKLRIIEEKSNKSVANQISVSRTLINKVSKQSHRSCDKNQLSPNSTITTNTTNGTINSSPNLRVPLTPTKTPPTVPISPSRSVLSPIRENLNSIDNFVTSSPSIVPLSPTRHSPIRDSSSPIPISAEKQSTARRSLRISNSSTAKLNGNDMTPQKTISEIRAIFTETDESEFEYFESPPSESLPKPIALPPKKRKPTTTPSPEKPIISSTRNKKSVQSTPRKTSKSHSWPSRKKNYPRKKRYPCDYLNCSYIADRPSTLVRHCRAHTGEKPYKCDWPGCDKRYKMSSNLTPHKLTHTGQKPYKCDWPQCDKKFTYPQHLKRHRIGHQKRSRRQRADTFKAVKVESKKIKQADIVVTT